jgi:broad specificity phosphatase PhoE
MKVILVSPGQTEWSAKNRLKGDLDVPLNENGVSAVEKVAEQWAGENVSAVYCPTSLDGTQTATIIARITQAKMCPRKDLNEADPGLWQGLTAEELKRRHPHVYERWMKSPTSVRPPRGEEFAMVFGRVRTVLAELGRHKGDEVIVCVVPSLIRRVLASQLRGTSPEEASEPADQDGEFDIIEL